MFAQGTASANPVSVLITDGDTHSSRKWAEMTVGRIMEISPDMSNSKARQAVELRQGLVHILGEAFEKAKSWSLQHHWIDTATIGADLAYKVGRCAHGTPWQLAFTHPEAQKAMTLEIRRSLNTIVQDQRSFHGAT
jgi:hypothetical protein